MNSLFNQGQDFLSAARDGLDAVYESQRGERDISAPIAFIGRAITNARENVLYTDATTNLAGAELSEFQPDLYDHIGN